VFDQQRVIAEDGRIVWNGYAPVPGTRASSDGSYVYFPGVTGTHTFAWGPGGGR
jgi:hypothetical protein